MTDRDIGREDKLLDEKIHIQSHKIVNIYASLIQYIPEETNETRGKKKRRRNYWVDKLDGVINCIQFTPLTLHLILGRI